MKTNPGTIIPLLAAAGCLALWLTGCTTAEPRGGSYQAHQTTDQPTPQEAWYYGGPNYGGGDVIDAPLPGTTPPRRSPSGR